MRRKSLRILAVGTLLLGCRSFSIGRFPLIGGVGSMTAVETPPATLPAVESLTAIPLHVGRGVRGPWFEVYFTDPADPAAAQFTGGIDERLVEAIDDARLSVHIAMYSLSLGDVGAALIRAQRRGVEVRIVMESDNIDGEVPQRLKEAGIPLLGDRREGSMHDKFMIIDADEVWTGSMNFTSSGAYSDDNNVIRILSPKVAEDYEHEFTEMFVDDHFGPDLGSSTPNPRVQVDGTSIEVLFSPDDHVRSALLQLVDAATSSIYFLAYSFTSDELGAAMLRAQAAGLKVAGVMDADQGLSNLGTELAAFRDAGLDVRLDGNPGQMHNKVLIVDDKIVVLGSYNFTGNAERTNDENLVVIHSPSIAKEYLQEFRRIYDLAGP